MKTGKITSRAVSALSAALAAAMFMTTALASSVPSGDSPAVATSGGKDLQLSAPVLVENGEAYLPLRTFLETCSADTELIWNRDFSVVLNRSYPDSTGNSVKTSAAFAIDKKECVITKNGTDRASYPLENAAILRNDRTYIPYSLAVLLNRETAMTDGFEITVGQETKQNEPLEKALIWANALKTRDGKPRYDIMTPAMQQAFIAQQKAFLNDNGNWNYVIGVSSPWTVSYDICITGDTADITYYQTDSSGARYAVSEKITFAQSGTSLLVADSEDLGVTGAADS